MRDNGFFERPLFNLSGTPIDQEPSWVIAHGAFSEEMTAVVLEAVDTVPEQFKHFQSEDESVHEFIARIGFRLVTEAEDAAWTLPGR